MRAPSRTQAQSALVSLCCALGLAVCAQGFCASVRAAEEPAHPAALDDAIIAAAKRHGVPESLVRRIIMRESKYNPKARNHSFWGLMQISYPTAKSMGFKGTREQLLNPVVNLRYAVPYLANAFVIAGKREDAAVRLYAAGYYFTARSKGLLNVLRTADSVPLSGVPDDVPLLAANAVAQVPQSIGIFGALFGPGQQPQPVPTQVAAYSADATPQSAPQAAMPVAPQVTAAPAGTFDGAAVAMVADKTGAAAPPKKWTHDGGMTLIARGEQPLDQVADRDHAAADAAGKAARHRARKITTFAALDLPPATAQAYAGAPASDPHFAATESQAAIAQATGGSTQATAGPSPATSGYAQAPTPTGEPIALIDTAGHEVASAAVPQIPVSEPVSEDKPVKRVRTRQAKHHNAGGAPTRQALADKPAEPAQPAAAQ